MSELASIESALRAAGLAGVVASVVPMRGGCIHRTIAITLDSGQELVAKLGGPDMLPLLVEEAASLDALADTCTVLVPERLVVGLHAGQAVLLMRRVVASSGSPDAWGRFGRDLAALHAVETGTAYGFDVDNHLGTTLQVNTWSDDWVAFNRACRLGPQIDLAAQRGLLEAGERKRLERLLDRLDELLPARPRPALLHGDLWSGNALPTETASGPTVAVIDPACSVGDGQADLAMMQLFGGFPASCFAAYEEAARASIDPTRILVYQLYHLLNHVNLFGRGYVGQAMDVVGRL